MKYLSVMAGLCLALSACTHTQPKPFIPPRASTAAIGVKLEELNQTLDQLASSNEATKRSISQIDDKAVQIQEALRNW